MDFNININEFRHSITIERLTQGKDEDNIPFETWQKLFNSRAKVLNVRGEEFYNALSVNSKVSNTFYIRFNRNHTISTKDRIIYNNKIYNILYINNIEEANKYLEIKAEVIN